MSEIILKLKEANLLGRGGANFPVWQKWEAVAKNTDSEKYIICNGAEGEPDVHKDEYIIKNYSNDVIDGIAIAIKEFSAKKAYLYLNHNYYDKYKDILSGIIGQMPIEIIAKGKGYIAGEETAICEFIEKGFVQPRQKPPFISDAGLWGKPTLLNNVETFYHIAKISKGEYKDTRFISIEGDVANSGTFEKLNNLTINEVLKDTGNYPDFDFFVQVGGGAEGLIMLPSELNVPLSGCGALKVFNKEKTDIFALMEYWADFLNCGNCDKCVPCREGMYRIWEMIKNRDIDKEKLFDLFDVLEKTSFCGLGRGASGPFKSLILKLNFEKYGKEKN
ncbi:MAG: NADH-ubiquinone oxidoreductase-F iron-sulfur binding region domain-containing protein [Candidatus Pacebacteria bacterium]|nr:NADH-ubiquinone oxidoreductase-F iron-sulfur binding region domain-containing protein [Candidatus Paceibacterota bacterium]